MTEKPKSVTFRVSGGGKITVTDFVSTADQLVENDGGEVKLGRGLWLRRNKPKP